MSNEIASRTPFRVGPTVTAVVHRLLKDWVAIEIEPTDDHILYLYRHRIARRLYGFVLIQAMRRSGRITAELAITTRPVYPIYPGRMQPSLTVDGVRDRLALIQGEESDRWWRYFSAETLESTLKEMLVLIRERGFDIMKELYETRIEQDYMAAREMVREWRALEEQAGERPLGNRFDGLTEEQRAYDYAEHFIWQGAFEEVLGPLLKRYEDYGWLSCHVYCMARLLETLTIDEVPDTTVPQVVGDEILAVTQRVPSYLYMFPPETDEEKVLRYAFLRSLSMVEACYDNDSLYEEGTETYGGQQWD